MGIDSETLYALCDLYRMRPEVLLSEQSRQYAQCCQVPYVNETVAICGRVVTIAGADFVVSCDNFSQDYVRISGRDK